MGTFVRTVTERSTPMAITIVPMYIGRITFGFFRYALTSVTLKQTAKIPHAIRMFSAKIIYTFLKYKQLKLV